MPNFTYVTYTEAVAALSARLYDETNQQWTVAELTIYLNEALRTFNALSGFWRAEMVFPLAQNTNWTDLRTVAGSLIPYTVTQYDILTAIEDHLLEPPTPAVWTGSAQFALQDLLTACQRRQDDTLGTAGCTITRTLVPAALTVRTLLPDNTIDLRRVMWIPTSGFGYANKILRQSDMFAERAFNSYYTTTAPGPPSTWMQNTEPPPSFDVDIIPPVPGQYEVLTVNSGGDWVAGTDALLSVPDDWSWVIKWGALQDLFSRESNAKDSLRAEYCKARYQEGLALLEMMPTALAFRVNNIPWALDAVRNGDDFAPGWQTATPGAPTSAYADANLIAVGPQPNSSGYSATVSVIQNAPVGGTYIQVARDDYPSILDYAQHLALLKSGGAEFAATIPLYQRFQRKAAEYNGKLKEMGFFSMPQLELSVNEEMQRPRYLPGSGPA